MDIGVPGSPPTPGSSRVWDLGLIRGPGTSAWYKMQLLLSFTCSLHYSHKCLSSYKNFYFLDPGGLLGGMVEAGGIVGMDKCTYISLL